MVPAPQGTMSALGKIAERSEKAVEALRIREQMKAAPAPLEPAPAPAPSPASALPALSKDMEQLTLKLNAAARDIVEAVDGTLPRDFEKRYAAGEADIYTRRVFEGIGRRLERAIAERYAGDRMMRSRVDSYVRLFERLLDTMNAAKGGEALVEACLASESGRIYVMLAETAGRIPPQR